MYPKYVIKDVYNDLVSQCMKFTQGEAIRFAVFLLRDDGSPFFFAGTPSEVTVSIFKATGQSPILKTKTGNDVTLLTDATFGNFGFVVNLASADTAAMVVNNAGLPVKILVTGATQTPLEFDFAALLNPLIAAFATS